MPRDWKSRVRDILDSIEKIQRYTQDLSFEEFSRSDMIGDAVERNLITIGKAAGYIPEGVREKYPEVPWSEMRGIRNIAAHRYFGVDQRIVWDTVEQDLPPLVSQLERILEIER